VEAEMLARKALRIKEKHVGCNNTKTARNLSISSDVLRLKGGHNHDSEVTLTVTHWLVSLNFTIIYTKSKAIFLQQLYLIINIYSIIRLWL
jgi:hypothetical protein